MDNKNSMITAIAHSIGVAIAWCLAWGNERKPQFDLSLLQQMREALITGKELPENVQDLVTQVEELQTEEVPMSLEGLKNLTAKYANWNSEIGLVYGGATKIKQYVFEASKLPDIRGASALLDRINLVDLPAFFGCENHPDYDEEQCQRAKDYCEEVRTKWLDEKHNFPGLSQALIPELIIYSTGGNILAFCPAAFVDDLANAIEKRYTEETLTANSCAVGYKFKLLEIKCGLLPNVINDDTFWLEKYKKNLENPIIKAYFEQADISEPEEAFKQRKTFNELAGKLASLFNQRRSGNDTANRPSRRYPPIFETHPYIVRDEGDRRSSVMRATELPDKPWLSEASARKRLVGQISKREDSSTNWYDNTGFTWKPGEEAIESWVNKFEKFLEENGLAHNYYQGFNREKVEEARSLIEIGNASKPDGFVAYIYADGNNMGGYIQKIPSPEEYRQFSKDISDATENSVYIALYQHLRPHKLNNIKDPEKIHRNGCTIHPFEILTIGGDDVMLIVPANQALAIAKTIGEEFECRLAEAKKYQIPPRCFYHRYNSKSAIPSQCQLSMSSGVLITADNTPIYYAEKLTAQLLKSAKKQAKELKKYGYYGGTVDFLVMKSVTMISSNINEFRSNGLTKTGNLQQKLKLYAAPYTLHEIGGLLETAKALKDADFPKSQIYQIRSLLERGKQTAMLNYRYFKVRLRDKEAQKLLKDRFEEVWCKPKDPENNGNLAPWMSLKDKKEDTDDKVTYETIWRELVDLYPFIENSKGKSNLYKAEERVLQS